MKANQNGYPSLTLGQTLRFWLIHSISLCIVLNCILRLNYSLFVLLGTTGQSDVTLVHWLSEYVGFVAMNIIDFIQGIGFLYLFYLMGMKTRKELLLRSESNDRGIYSINALLTHQAEPEINDHKSLDKSSDETDKTQLGSSTEGSYATEKLKTLLSKQDKEFKKFFNDLML